MGLLLANVLGAAAYRLLVDGGLERSSALFLGLPLLIGTATAQWMRTRSVGGRAIQANILFLACVAPLLGEASLCLFMAAPLFIGVSILATVIWAAFRRPGAMLGLLAIPLGLGLVEERTEWLAQPALVVVTEHVVDGSLESWRQVVREPTPPSSAASLWQQLGFPRPLSYRRDADGSLIVDFTPIEGQAGSWRVAAVSTEQGVRFEITDDSTKLARWVAIQSSTVDVCDAGDGQLILRQTTVCLPRLSPRAYFDRLFRWALRDAHALAAETWTEALTAKAMTGDDRL